ELFEEQVEIVLKAFREESFSHQGKHYTLPPIVPYRGYELRELTLVPRPIHRPVECWQPIVSASARGLDFMVRHGIKGVIGGGGGAAGVPTVEHYMKTGAWFAGPPEELAAYLEDLESRFPGLQHVNMSISMGTPKAVMQEQLRWFGKEVMPRFATRAR